MPGSVAHQDSVDRVAPTVRPSRPVVMYQNWHHLLFLHWAVPAAQLRPPVPRELDLDLFEGQAYIGLTPFTMTGVRPRGVPAARPVSDFHETNVRTYVHRSGRDPGVWFLSLDASNALAVLGAQLAFGLPYKFARIQFALGPGDGHAATGDRPGIDYCLRRRWPGPIPAHCDVRYAPQGPVSVPRVGTLEFFLAERYLLYSIWGVHLYLSRIHHAPWPLQRATVPALDETLIRAAGISRALDVPPLAHYAREQHVEVFHSERVR